MMLPKVVLVCGVCLPAVAACGDATGPRLADPTRIALQLDYMSGLLHSEPVENGARLSHSFAAAVTGTPSGGIFPAEALGTTYTWNLAAGRYEASGQEGAPDKVRFHVYALDPMGVAPVDPLAWISNLDFEDVSAGNPALRLRIASGIGVNAEYTVSGSAAYPTWSWAFAGSFGGIRKSLEFDGTWSSDGPFNSTLDVGFRDSLPDLGGRLKYTSTFDNVTYFFSVDFRLQLGADVVVVTGSGSFSSCVPYGGGGGGVLTVTVNGRDFATIVIDADGRETRRAELSPDEELALDAILRSTTDLWTGFSELVTPATQFLVH